VSTSTTTPSTTTTHHQQQQHQQYYFVIIISCPQTIVIFLQPQYTLIHTVIIFFPVVHRTIKNNTKPKHESAET